MLNPNDIRLQVEAVTPCHQASHLFVQEREPTQAEEERGRGKGQGCSSSVRLCCETLRSSKVFCSAPVASSLFLAHNTSLVPPYRVLIDTNFINFSLQNKLELVSGMMDCLYAKCMFLFYAFDTRSSSHLESGIPCVTDCVMAELEKLGPKYRIALRCVAKIPSIRYSTQSHSFRVARDPRFERLPCNHSGTYADDCLVQRVTAHKCYIVATCDRELRRRIRQIPGIPLMYIVKRRYAIERLPDQGAPS